jgi:sialate O-acetylesterase
MGDITGKKFVILECFYRVSIIILLVFVTIANADVKLPAIISDNMVIQADKEIKIWGWAEPNEKITVAIDKQTVNTKADDNGKWLVKLKPIPKGVTGKPYEMIVKGNNTITIKNILVGEVWLASGQSNMVCSVNISMNSEQETKNANYPMIRLFTVRATPSLIPVEDLNGTWIECSPDTVRGFSAVAYFFGRNIHEKLNIPVGLINSSWGDTPAEAWTSLEGVRSSNDLRPIVIQLENLIKQFKEDEHKKKVSGFREPTVLFNSMISPITNFTIRGVIWYQGESNVQKAYQYRKLFPAMIEDWRKKWNDSFPFLYVQLANFMERKPFPSESSWSELREIQLMTLSVSDTAMAVAIDIGDEKNIHPLNKQDVGLRLSLAALSKVYGKDIIYSGPIYKSMKIEDNKIRLYFEHIGGGLKIGSGNELKGFAIAGKDKKFYWANAIIDGDTVIVSNENVTKPYVVRYAWADNPECNLYNKENLPASPFRTDNPYY